MHAVCNAENDADQARNASKYTRRPTEMFVRFGGKKELGVGLFGPRARSSPLWDDSGIHRIYSTKELAHG